MAELEKAKAIMATRPGPIIMLPTHKSHMDYLTVHYVCAMYGLPLPCAVAGDNLNVPVIGAILRGCGAVCVCAGMLHISAQIFLTRFQVGSVK